LARFIPLWFAGAQEDADDFFLGGRDFVWPLIGFSLFATNMSGASFVGLAGAGYNQGISVYNYEWSAAIILIFFIFFILPFYLRSGVYTMPGFLEKRYDVRSRRVFSGINLFFNMFIDAAGALYAGALVFVLLFDIPLWMAVAALALLAAIISVFGGLKAVVISDTVQAIMLIIGGTTVAIAAYLQLPSWGAVVDTAGKDALSIFKPPSDPEMPWPGLFTGVLVIGTYFWTSNQLIVQRTLGAKTINHGRWGSLFAGFLKLPVLFFMILPGTMALVLYPNLSNADMVFPTLVFDLLPAGVSGLVLAALVAAITSSIDSILNSASTLVTMDFVKPLYPDLSDRGVVLTGQVATAGALLVAIIWAPQIARFETLWGYLQSVLAYTTPPIVATFVGGIFWTRANRHGAFVTLLLGVSLGVVFFVLNEIMGVFAIQFLYAAGVSLVMSVLILVGVSLLTEPPPAEKTEKLTWDVSYWHAETEALERLAWWQNYRYHSILLVLCTAVILYFFA
ncbi:MAG: sodium/solute symporter, partial [Salinibacter sp.]|uniref:sodium:solute symporter family transporter n=1 Tax=Salinibacter sp. TaxID=2065818 RepID=UPI0035D4F631